MSASSPWLWVAVAAAGSLGAVLRFWLGRVIGARQEARASAHHPAGRPSEPFPWAVLAANTLACLFIGATIPTSGTPALLIATGLCGGLSTMSTLAVGTVSLASAGPPRRPVLYLALTLVLGAAALWLGRGIALMLLT